MQRFQHFFVTIVHMVDPGHSTDKRGTPEAQMSTALFGASIAEINILYMF